MSASRCYWSKVIKQILLICGIAIAFGSSYSLKAQQYYLNQHAWKETWENLKIQVIHQDQQSIIWVGTDQGLFRYDGFEYHFYEKPDKGSQSVTSIYQSKIGAIWVGFSDGSIAQLHRDKLMIKSGAGALPNVPIKGFAEDPDGNLWIATYGAGFIIMQTDKLIPFNMVHGLPSDEIYATIADSEGRIWAATDQGISFCKYQKGAREVKAPSLASGIPKDIMQSLLLDEKGNIWIGRYDQSPLKYDAKSKTANPIMADWPYGVVTVIEPATSGELWVATASYGLMSFNLMNGIWYPKTFSPDQTKVRISAMHCDPEFNLWIGSLDNGLQSTNLVYSYLAGSLVNAQALLSESDGSLFIGSEKGLFHQNTNSTQVQKIKQIKTPIPLNIVSLSRDHFGNIWIGTFGDFLFIYQPKSARFRQIKKLQGLDNESILSMYSQDKSVWLATLGGVYQIDLTEDPMLGKPLDIKNLHAEKAIGTSFIYQVTKDRAGNIWFATDGKGIASMKNGKIQQYPNALIPETKTVYSISADSKGTIWMGTARNGLYKFSNNKLLPFGQDQGLRNTDISMVIVDRLDRILIVHPEGIDRYNPVTRQFSYFDQESGLDGIRPNINAYTIDSSGVIWMGTQNGLLRYQVLQGIGNKYVQPGLGLLDVLNQQESVLNSGKNEFNFRQNFLTFQYQGSWYSNPSLLRYRYKLVGQDKDWRYTREMEANYSKLNPGKYEFQVQVSTSNQFSVAPTVKYSFVINPPFYANSWFLISLLILLGGGVYFWILEREQTAIRKSQLQKERIEFQFNSLKNQINPHFLFNSLNTLTTLIEEDSVAAVRYVENLSDFYRSILQFGETDLVPVTEELELVRHYIFLLDQRFGNNLDIDIDIVDTSGMIPPLALQMLVENAIKHNIISQAKPLSVKLYDEAGKLWVTNTLQRKLKPEISSGIGLQNIISRYKLLNAPEVIVQEKPDQFIVGIPRIL